MTQDTEQQTQESAEIEKATLPEAALAYLNAIEDSLAVLSSHITNSEIEEAKEMILLLSSQTTELRSLLLAEMA